MNVVFIPNPHLWPTDGRTLTTRRLKKAVATCGRGEINLNTTPYMGRRLMLITDTGGGGRSWAGKFEVSGII